MASKDKIKQVRNISIIAGVFTTMVTLLMLLNYLQISSGDPLDTTALKVLVERLSQEPNNEQLMQDIRQLDLLARRAYFNSIWQIRVGGFLMLIGAIVLAFALRSYHSLTFAIDKPTTQELKEKQIRRRTEMWVGLSGLGVLLLAGLSSVLSVNNLKDFGKEPLDTQSIENHSTIEVVEITPRADMAQIPADKSTDESEEIVEELKVEKDKKQEIEEKTKPEAKLTRESVWQNHNAFRGPWGNAVSRHKNIPTQWDGQSGKNILWKTEIPIHGYNSPVIWGDRIFLTGANATKRVIYCIHRHTGKILWEREANNIQGSPSTPPKTTDDTGLAAPSVTVDGHRVYAIFGTGDVIALDFEGNRQWARNLGVPDNHYGHSSSLLVWDNMVFVQYDTQSGARIMAVSTSTGETLWNTPRQVEVSWASPVMAEVDGKLQLLLLTVPDFRAYDPQTGKELWSVNCMSGEIGPSPTYGGGLVYAGNEYAKMVAVNPTTGEQVWETRYYLPEVASPIYHDGVVYIATTFAVIAAFDAATGEFLWEMDADDQFYSSPAIADGKLYVFDTNGKAYILETNRNEPKLIASPELGESVYSNPAFAEGRIYIRANRNLYCIGE